jgi:hypothetical protein
MIKLTLHNRLRAIVNPKYIVYAVEDKLGTQVQTTHGTLGVVEDYDTVLKVWHDSCTNITNSTNISTNIVEEPKISSTNNTTTNSSNSNNSNGSVGAVVGDGKILLLNNIPVPVDPSVKPKLYDYCKANQQLIELLEYWVSLYEEYGGEYNMVSAVDLGTVSRVVRTGAIDKARAVFDWLFTSDHYRAKYLREKGMVNPAVVVSSKKLNDNYALSQVKPLPPLPKSVRTNPRRSSIPTFDKDGNLIGGE